MNGATIRTIFNQDPYTRQAFLGFNTPDLHLPNIRHTPSFIILNTDYSFEQGEHWCVICFDNKKNGYFFDSFGFSPLKYKFDFNYLKQLTEYKLMYNSYPVQYYTSSVCGHHCIFFCYYFSRGINPERILDCFHNKNLKSNDLYVYTFVQNTFGHKLAKVQF